MTDKVQKIREEVVRLKQCTMDEHMKFYSESAEAEYNALCKIDAYIDSLQEEPVSEDLDEAASRYAEEEYNHKSPATLPDRCRGCYAPLMYAFKAGAKWQNKHENPVSEEFEKALAEEWKGYIDRGAATVDALEDNTQELTFAKGFYRGSEWKEEQFEKNRLKHCDSITKEQAELEQGFIDQHLDKNKRMPTFLDAIEYGMNQQKEQMIKNAVDSVVAASAGGDGWVNIATGFVKSEDVNVKFGDKIKIIIIKEE